MGLSAEQVKVLGLLRSGCSLNAKAIATALKIDPKSVEADINLLLSLDVIVVDCPEKPMLPATYKIKD